MCKALPAIDFQKSHQRKQERIIGQRREIKLFLKVIIKRNFNSWGVGAFNQSFETSSSPRVIASKQTAQNILMATHQDSIMFHYSPLRTLNKGLRTSPETKFPLISSVY